MDFNVIPSTAILHFYFGSLFASDGQTNGQTDGRRANFLERYVFDNHPGHPFGVDNSFSLQFFGKRLFFAISLMRL